MNAIYISTQKVDTWKKLIHVPGLLGRTAFQERSNSVNVTASRDHQGHCNNFFQSRGRNQGKIGSNVSYLIWHDVSALDIVGLIHHLSKQGKS